jgi:hypothetical protein
MPLRIASADHDRAILVCDDEHNDVAEFYHADHATVGQSYETAYGYANRLISHDALVKAAHAAKQFIENGVELGYIRMPAGSDPAHDTLPKINAALALCEQEGGSRG